MKRIKKSNKKFLKIAMIFAFLLKTNFIFAVEWPVEEISESSFRSYFAQNRGGFLSTSMIFSEPSEVKAAEDGQVLIIVTEENDDTDFFPSALGNFMILSHNDNLISVYANLENDLTVTGGNLRAGQKIANSGNSAWQQDLNSLELQLIDTKEKSAINPKVMMKREDIETELFLQNIMLENKDKVQTELNVSRNFSSGTYRVYCRRSDIAVPYSTIVSVNGVATDSLKFNTINQENSKIFVSGKKKYTGQDIYPDNTHLLLGEITLPPGRGTLGLTVTDILGKSKNIVYNLTVN